MSLSTLPDDIVTRGTPAFRSNLMEIGPRRRARRLLGSLTAALLVVWLVGCSVSIGLPTQDKTFAITTVLPTSGPDAAIGQAMQQAVDLAVKQNAALGNGFTLTAVHVDEAGDDPGAIVSSLAGNQRVMGIIGPLDSQSAVAMLPGIEQAGITTISPGATLPGLTQADQAAAEGLQFAQLHPQGKPVAFFRLPESDTAAGKVAADLAVAPVKTHGLAAQSVFLVDDGTPSGKTLAGAFVQELKAKGGTSAGRLTLQLGVPDSAQAAVTAIVKAAPDIVFFGGGAAAAAQLRGTLSLTGAQNLAILTVGQAADHPDWGTAVGVAAAAANTTALLPAPDLSTLDGAKDFIAAYQAAYAGQDPLPQAALAYDAAMDEVAAIKSLVGAGKQVTRADVLATVASAKHAGVSGTLAFDAKGDNTTPLGFSLYTCDAQGAWHFVTALKG